MRDHDHHAEQKRDRVEVDGAKSFLEAQGTDRDHRRAAKKGDARAVEPQAWNAAHGDADIGQREDDERGYAFESHSPAAAPSASGSGSWARVLVACFRHEGKEDENATAAAAPRARNETL